MKIKLLSGKNVVLVEAEGHESEIFMPQIVNGRISFQNIIPNRRCCSIENSNAKPHQKHYSMASQESSIVDRKVLQPLDAKTASVWRMSAGHLPPLAFSTPASTPIASKENIKVNHRSCSEIMPPEQARSSAPTSFHDVTKNMLLKMPSCIQVKVRRLYRNPTEQTPKRVGRVVGTRPGLSNSSFSNHCTSTPQQNSSGFLLPATPNFSLAHSRARSSATPLQHLASATKWRKCITPIRTYLRKPKAGVNTNRSIKKVATVPDSKQVMTQGAKPNYILEIRKRKLLIDPKVAISPHSFKKQQSDTNDLKVTVSHSQLPAKRRQYERSKGGTFDMLTNSNRMRALSAKLNQQFRNGCINKAASTYPKYKLLCTIPPLQQDEQTYLIHSSQIDHQQLNGTDRY